MPRPPYSPSLCSSTTSWYSCESPFGIIPDSESKGYLDASSVPFPGGVEDIIISSPSSSESLLPGSDSSSSDDMQDSETSKETSSSSCSSSFIIHVGQAEIIQIGQAEAIHILQENDTSSSQLEEEEIGPGQRTLCFPRSCLVSSTSKGPSTPTPTRRRPKVVSFSPNRPRSISMKNWVGTSSFASSESIPHQTYPFPGSTPAYELEDPIPNFQVNSTTLPGPWKEVTWNRMPPGSRRARIRSQRPAPTPIQSKMRIATPARAAPTSTLAISASMDTQDPDAPRRARFLSLTGFKDRITSQLLPSTSTSTTPAPITVVASLGRKPIEEHKERKLFMGAGIRAFITPPALIPR